MSYYYCLWERENCNFLFMAGADILSSVTRAFPLRHGELWRVDANIKMYNCMKGADDT